MVEYKNSDTDEERQLKRQIKAEVWIPVRRNVEDELEARPAERQEEIMEAEKVYSDNWVIREPNGKTYTVTWKEFEEKFESNRNYVTQQFVIDMSWERDIESVTMGADNKLLVEALIDITQHTIVSLDILTYTHEGDRIDGPDGIPIEVFDDHPEISEVDEE